MNSYEDLIFPYTTLWGPLWGPYENPYEDSYEDPYEDPYEGPHKAILTLMRALWRLLIRYKKTLSGPYPEAYPGPWIRSELHPTDEKHTHKF